MNVGFFEKSPGNKSMMRLLAFMGFILGGIVVLWGMALLTIASFSVMNLNESAFKLIGPLAMVVSGGLAVATGGQAFKAIQQRGEVKESSLNKEGN